VKERNLKAIFGVVVSLLVLAMTVSLYAAKGTVAHTVRGCDYYTVESSSGFAVLEWYGGAPQSRGDVIVGAFDSYGFTTVFNVTRDAESRVWVDDYMLSKQRALETLYDKCD
jgi:hypothetical protein